MNPYKTLASPTSTPPPYLEATTDWARRRWRSLPAEKTPGILGTDATPREEHDGTQDPAKPTHSWHLTLNSAVLDKVKVETPKLIKTHNLLPSRNYIFGYHPHGIFCFGAFCNFSTEATGFSKKFPGIRPSLATLAGNFRLPLLRDYMMFGGICPVNRNSIDYLLSRNGTGNAVVIVVGGAAESLDCAPGLNSVTLKNRKGFVKLALQKGADLVPVYSFGENEAYKQVMFAEGSWWRHVQRRLQKLLGFAPCLFHGCGFFSSESWGMVPYCKPINTVVGEPITVPKVEDPTPDTIDMYHTMYINSLTTLFDKYKTRFGLKETDYLLVR
ncbi:hypothetical protein MHYP_G00182950 [Metynnis hypsauchen]